VLRYQTMKNTLYIVWNEYNNLGIAVIDEQHRGIVAIINSLHYFIQEGQGEDVLVPTLGMLEHYTRIHFLTEEA
jgi:hemerythrin